MSQRQLTRRYAAIRRAMMALVFISLHANAAPSHRILARRHEVDSWNISRKEVEKILQKTSELLTDMCPNSTRPYGARRPGHKIQFKLVKKIGVFPESSADLYKKLILKPEHASPTRFIYMVRHIPKCDGKLPEAGYPFMGCSSLPGNVMLLAMSAAAPGTDPESTKTNQTRTEEWYNQQARVWAHELGHNLGLCHSDKSNDLLYHTVPNEPKLTDSECACYFATFDYHRGCPTAKAIKDCKAP